MGVAAPDFKGTFTIRDPSVIWIPISMHAQVLPGPQEGVFNNRRIRMLYVFGRLKPGIAWRQALAAMQTAVAVPRVVGSAYTDSGAAALPGTRSR